MPRRLGPVIAVALLVGLGGWVYFSEYKKEDKGKDQEAKDRPIVFKRPDLKSIRLRNEHGQFTLEKSGEAWSLTAPFPADTDKDAVESLLTALDVGRIERRIGEEKDLKTYGLDPPRALVTLGLASTPAAVTLGLGDNNPVGGSYFALLPGGKEVALVSAGLGDLEKKDLASLRDKSLLSFDPWKVKRLKIERGKETVLLEKPADGWKLQQPVEAPADGPTVTDLLSALERLRATGFEAEHPKPADLRRSGLEPPAARMTILQEGWDVEKTVLVGKTKDGSLFARTVGRDPVLTIPKDFWEKVATKVSDLRRKEILGVGQYRIDTITASRDGRPAVVLTRQKDGSWTLTGSAKGSVKADSMDTFLRLLGSLKALSWNDRPAEAARAALARKPALDLTLHEEAEGNAAAKTQHLVFGAPAKDGAVPVRDMAWHPIATLASGSLAGIDGQIDSLLKEASEAPKPQPSPGTAPSPSPAK